MGYITSQHFDAEIRKFILWGAIWKIRADVAMPGLGAMLEAYAFYALDPFTVAGLGKSPDSRRISKSNHDMVGVTNRYYIRNDRLSNYILCLPGDGPAHTPCERGQDSFAAISREEYCLDQGSAFNKILPYKSKAYYIARYFEHPMYTYHVTAIKTKDGDTKAVIFWRFCEHAAARCIRIVDYICLLYTSRCV